MFGWLRKWLNKDDAGAVPAAFVYAVAADFLPKDKMLTKRDYREAIGKATELLAEMSAMRDRLAD